jgi:hypothetical protein
MKLLLAFFSLILAVCPQAYAAPKYTQAKQAATKVTKAQKDFSRKVSRLSDADKAKLKSSFKGTDSDGDGVADSIEAGIGSNVCGRDSDSDGLDDGQDDSETNPDHNGDGTPDGSDGQEVEARGTITTYNDPTLVVSGKSFTLTDSTRFDSEGLSKGDLTVGLCVEVQGHATTSGNIADKIERKGHC